jgi:exodeoxyribonuclease VII large subunit
VSQASFDLDLDDGGLPTFTVGEFAEAINATLKRGFYEGAWVRGEIQGWREGPNGHAYFNLVDDTDGVKATIAVSFFANSRMRLRPLLTKHRLRLGDGMKVRLHGYPDLYAPSGRLGLKMAGIDPRYTLGEIAIARDELIRRLVADGSYDAQRRLKFPAVPLRIGVVTSVGSAAWHDFTHELEQSGFGMTLLVADVRVQGDGAATMIGRAVRSLSNQAVEHQLDVIVVVRGGGSRSDLAAFDHELVARAIAAAPVPVLTGLGHEIDRSVADDVAHRSLKTPTACAGALIEALTAARDRSEVAWASIVAVAGRRLERAERRLDDLDTRVGGRTRGAVDLASARLDRDAARLQRASRQVLTNRQGHIERAAGRLPGDSRRHLRTSALILDGIEARVKLLDPAASLARGWTLTRRSDGSLVRSWRDVQPGEQLTTIVHGGRITSRVDTSEANDSQGAPSE